MNTDRLMHLALTMADLTEIPGDSAIYVPGEGIERVLMGIDLESPELMMAKEMGFDAVLSHHPAGGSAKLRFYEVLYRHVQQMVSAGVPEAQARRTVEAWAEEQRVLASISNYDHNPSVARTLRMPYLNIHTPLDEIGRRRLQAAADEVPSESSVSTLIDHLHGRFCEFQHAQTSIELRIGKPEAKVGRVVMSHGAGTNGGYRVAKAYFDAGVDTVIYIHCRPADAERLRAEYGEGKSLIVTGHIASDSIGINPYIERLQAEGIAVTAISGILPSECGAR
ncbi:MAG TPA: hypothetical protein ENN96_00150 [Candidatus Acetothermia bacterium]|nr:hypothetical protein [Candidatus Acetothermia bacterium]